MRGTVILRQVNDKEGSQRLSASVTDDGDLVFEGVDYGDGVEAIFGEREYEYAITVRAVNIPALLEAMGSERELLPALQELFREGDVAGPSALLEGYGIPFEFWSRTGS